MLKVRDTQTPYATCLGCGARHPDYPDLRSDLDDLCPARLARGQRMAEVRWGGSGAGWALTLCPSCLALLVVEAETFQVSPVAQPRESGSLVHRLRVDSTVPTSEVWIDQGDHRYVLNLEAGTLKKVALAP